MRDSRIIIHAYTNENQIMWNGVISDLSLKFTNKLSIKNVNIFPDIDKKGTRVVIDVANETGQPASGTIKLTAQIKGKNLEPKLEKLARLYLHCIYRQDLFETF